MWRSTILLEIPAPSRSRRRGRQLQPVADSVDREQVAALAGIGLNLLAEPDDHLVERAGGAEVFDSPDFVEELIAADDIAGMAEEERQDF